MLVTNYGTPVPNADANNPELRDLKWGKISMDSEEHNMREAFDVDK